VIAGGRDLAVDVRWQVGVAGEADGRRDVSQGIAPVWRGREPHGPRVG
jgi:hypothetical protein